jgi:hypothetical protein
VLVDRQESPVFNVHNAYQAAVNAAYRYGQQVGQLMNVRDITDPGFAAILRATSEFMAQFDVSHPWRHRVHDMYHAGLDDAEYRFCLSC